MGAVFVFTHGFLPAVLDNCQYMSDDSSGTTAAICALNTSLKPRGSCFGGLRGHHHAGCGGQRVRGQRGGECCTTDEVAENSTHSKGQVTKRFKARAHTGQKLVAKAASTR